LTPRAALAPSTSPMPQMPKVPIRSIDSRLGEPSRPPVLPMRPSAPPTAPIAPAATTIGPAPTAPPVMAAPPAMFESRASDVPPTSSLTAAMLIPRPSSVHPPAATRATDPGGSAGGGDAIRERLAQFEVTSSATRAIATRVETEAKRAHTRLDTLEPRVAANESMLRDRLTQMETGLGAARKELEERVTQLSIAGPAARPESEGEGTGSLKTALATLRQTIAEHERQFEARRARVESVETRVAGLDPKLTELRRATESFDLRLLALERAQEALRVDVDQRLKAMESRLSEGPATGTRKAAAPEPELRRIKGVGPKYEKALREIGITTIAQVAAMGDEELARVAAQLSVPVDRVRKLGWPETARALLTE
jgi:predicted flap endonuclease-1-like 5' DNA nuclease